MNSFSGSEDLEDTEDRDHRPQPQSDARLQRWGSPPPCWLAAPSAAAQCVKDTDCKGDRVCEKGGVRRPWAKPVDPSTSTPAATRPASAPGGRLRRADRSPRRPPSRSARCWKAPATAAWTPASSGCRRRPATPRPASMCRARRRTKWRQFGESSSARPRRADRRRGIEDVLRRHHQGYHRHCRRDVPRRRPRRLRGGAVHKELEMSQPQLLAWLTRQLAARPTQGLSLGRRDGGNRPLPGDNAAATCTKRSRGSMWTSLPRPATPAPAASPVTQLLDFFAPAETKERKRA